MSDFARAVYVDLAALVVNVLGCARLSRLSWSAEIWSIILYQLKSCDQGARNVSWTSKSTLILLPFGKTWSICTLHLALPGKLTGLRGSFLRFSPINNKAWGPRATDKPLSQLICAAELFVIYIVFCDHAMKYDIRHIIYAFSLSFQQFLHSFTIIHRLLLQPSWASLR